jgi:hypothetical protein
MTTGGLRSRCASSAPVRPSIMAHVSSRRAGICQRDCSSCPQEVLGDFLLLVTDSTRSLAW